MWTEQREDPNAPGMERALGPVYSSWSQSASVDTAHEGIVAPYFAGPVVPEGAVSQFVTNDTAAIVQVHGLDQPQSILRKSSPISEEWSSEPALSSPVTAVHSEQEMSGSTSVRDADPIEEAEMLRDGRKAGKEVSSVAPASAAAHDLAERLETIARRLRTDGTAAVVAGMRGDRFDALLAGLFAGYLAARDLDA